MNYWIVLSFTINPFPLTRHLTRFKVKTKIMLTPSIYKHKIQVLLKFKNIYCFYLLAIVAILEFPQWNGIILVLQHRDWQTMDHSSSPSLPVFVNKVLFVSKQSHSFIYVLSMAAFALQQQSWANVTDSMTHKAEDSYYMTFTEIVCQPLLPTPACRWAFSTINYAAMETSIHI